MDLDWLRYFRTVVEDGSMRKAANRLFVSEAALSKSIGKLEKELGCPLFERRGRGLQLTAAGQYYYDGIVPVLEELNTLARGLGEISGHAANGRESIIIEIGAFAARFLDKLISLRDSHDDLALRIASIDTTDARQRIADLAIISAPFDEERFEGIHLYDIEIGVAADPLLTLGNGDELDLQTLRGIPFIMPTGDSELKYGGWSLTRQLEVMCQFAGFTPRIVGRASNLDALITALHTQRSVALVPYEMRKDRIAETLRFYRIREPKCTRSYWIIWKKGRVLSDPMRQVIREIADEIRQHPDDEM